MAWDKQLAELRARESQARELGGADKVERQHKGGRLTVRERIDALVDTGSFHEIGALAGAVQYDEDGNISTYLPSNCVMGRAAIDGRSVVVTGDDFTVRGGAADATIHAKSRYPEEMARDLRLPIVRLIEGSGGGGSVKTIETKGRAIPAMKLHAVGRLVAHLDEAAAHLLRPGSEVDKLLPAST